MGVLVESDETRVETRVSGSSDHPNRGMVCVPSEQKAPQWAYSLKTTKHVSKHVFLGHRTTPTEGWPVSLASRRPHSGRTRWKIITRKRKEG